MEDLTAATASLTHIAHDAWLYGPPRGYWTFGFESFNKVIKRGAQLGNWKDEQHAIMQYWSMWHTRCMMREKHCLIQSV